MICNFLLLFSHSKNIRMSTLTTKLVLMNYCYNNNYKISQKVMELCLLNLLILIDCFLRNSDPHVLFESFSFVINQESHVYS